MSPFFWSLSCAHRLYAEQLGPDGLGVKVAVPIDGDDPGGEVPLAAKVADPEVVETIPPLEAVANRPGQEQAAGPLTRQGGVVAGTHAVDAAPPMVVVGEGQRAALQ